MPVTREIVTPILADHVDPVTGARVSVVVGERRETVALGTRLERVLVGTKRERREVSRRIEAVLVRPETTWVVWERVRPDCTPLEATPGPADDEPGPDEEPGPDDAALTADARAADPRVAPPR